MSSPLRRHTKRFAGNVKNLVYRLYPQGVSSPQMIESTGTRQIDEDYCNAGFLFSNQPAKFCLNKGRCYSTNDGPKCDCAFTDFEGLKCDKKKSMSELSFFANEWIGYDVTNDTAAIIKNRNENISLYFKTSHQNGLLFVAGDKTNYIQLSLEKGILIAASKLSGSDRRIIRMFNKSLNPSRYDDNKWHSVILYRDVHVNGAKYATVTMRLTVDGESDYVKQFATDTEWLGNSFAYVGGTIAHRHYIPIYSQNFQGCIKKIKYEADAQLLDLIELADQGYGKSVIRTAGDLTFACSLESLPPDVLFFNTGQSFISLPKWNSLLSGSIAFQFRTNKLYGLILYHGVKSISNSSNGDYISFEIIDGHLFIIINLGSGYIRLQTTSKQINDEYWHSVTFERTGRTGTVIVDGVKTDFSTPGVSANLIIEEPIYIGAVPWYPIIANMTNSDYEHIQMPSSVWTASLRQGFIGCLKNIRINGLNAQIVNIFESQNENSNFYTKGISLGCPNTIAEKYCTTGLCKYEAICVIENEKIYDINQSSCDESKNYYFEQFSSLDQTIISFSPALDTDSAIIKLPFTSETEAEDIDIRFRTEDDDAILLDTHAKNFPTDRILLTLINGELELKLDHNKGTQTFTWGSGLNDNQWHKIKIRRRGEKILLYKDNKWEHSYFLTTPNVIIHIDKIAVGHFIHSPISYCKVSCEESNERSYYDGEMSYLIFNKYDILHKLKAKVAVNNLVVEDNILQSKKFKTNSISFESDQDGYIMFSNDTLANISLNIYRISFKFKTLVSSGLLLLLTSNSTSKGDLAVIELIKGELKYIFGYGSNSYTTTIHLPYSYKLNDLKWHTVTLYQDVITGIHFISVDNFTATLTEVKNHKAALYGQLFLGGLPEQVHLPEFINTTRSFKGCLSSLKIKRHHLDLMNDSDQTISVVKGCRGPSERCTPLTCKNDGICHQDWRKIFCDCSYTAYSGKYCEDTGTSYLFDSNDRSAIYYEFSEGQSPSTIKDNLVLGFQTHNSNGVLLSLQCGVEGDYLTLFIGGGYVQLRYNLGSRDHHLGYFDIFVNDGRFHIIRLTRIKANITLSLDKHMAIKYSPSDKQNELYTLNMHQRISVGASFNIFHSLGTIRKKHRRSLKFFDEFTGKITGVNFNGLKILDLFAKGDSHVFSTGKPKLIHMAPEDKISSQIPPSAINTFETYGFFEHGSLNCLSTSEQGDCERVDLSDGFFTPVLPKSITSSSTNTVPTSTILITTTDREIVHERELPIQSTTVLHSTTGSTISATTPYLTTKTNVRTSSSLETTLYAVRPTTPMGDSILTTYKTPTSGDFPRTALISIASISVIVIIAIVVFCVFRCRQSGPPLEGPYPMVCSGKAPSATAAGYTPIPSDNSPQMHAHHYDAQCAPIISSNMLPTRNGGYQPLKGSVIPNGNSMNVPNGEGAGGILQNGGTHSIDSVKKKEFKEWYV
uniref:Neurexin-1 n=1 Tax=Acrobeloides nanus TaxID=290746 RepID=A0A914CHA1_9BILA